MSESQFKRCCLIVLRSCFVKISFSLENKRSPAQLITIMHMNTLSAISTLGNTDIKLSKIFFCTVQGGSHNFHQESCSA
jgi:hypothetical protein